MAKSEIITQVYEVNRISAGTEIKGNLISSSDIRLDGYFEGRLVTSGKLVIGEFAKLYGDVICRSCDIWGLMEGKLVVKEVFGLKKTGTITGNIGCEKIFIEEGGIFNGSCKIIDEATFEELKVKLS